MKSTIRRILDLLLGPRTPSSDGTPGIPDVWLAGLRIHG
jgi:hypothetical protein